LTNGHGVILHRAQWPVGAGKSPLCVLCRVTAFDFCVSLPNILMQFIRSNSHAHRDRDYDKKLTMRGNAGKGRSIGGITVIL